MEGQELQEFFDKSIDEQLSIISGMHSTKKIIKALYQRIEIAKKRKDMHRRIIDEYWHHGETLVEIIIEISEKGYLDENFEIFNYLINIHLESQRTVNQQVLDSIQKMSDSVNQQYGPS